MVLVGFMGAGKTTVGRSLARHLGWRFVDMDAAIEGKVGASVTDIFERYGEGRFRDMEEKTAERLLSRDRVVIASGGGWAARPGRLGAMPDGTASVWLEVQPEEALRRVGSQAGRRPLLDVGDPLSAARSLLDERAEHYAGADVRVDTTGRSVDDVTERILEIFEEHELDHNAE
jgi:shikimate kinase